MTVQFSGFDLRPDQVLEADVKYLMDITPRAVQERFSSVPGNAWAGMSIRAPAELRRTPEEMKRLLRERLLTVVGPGDCREERQSIGGGAGGFTLTKCDGATIRGPSGSTNATSDVKKVKRQLQSTLVDKLVDVLMTPTEVAGLPPAGSLDGQLTQPWGASGGASPYAVVFVPQSQVREHPGLTVRAWLHLQGQPGKILGTGRQIPGVDFAQRCRGEASPNPTPPVDSNTSLGKLCWYAFDLFGAGPRAQLEVMARDAAQHAAAQ